MALVYDYVAEVVLRVVGDEEARVGVVRGDVEGLVGGDEDAGVLLRVGGVDCGGVGAELVVESGEGLAAEFVAIAHEEGAPKLAGVGDAPEELDRDAGLAGAGGEGEEDARRPALSGRARDLLEGEADGGVLVVAAAALAARVAGEEGAGWGVVEREADACLVVAA